MRQTSALERELHSLRTDLLQAGRPDLVQRVDAVLELVRSPAVVDVPEDGVMTTGQAARCLGIRSVNTIKRWAREGYLEGFRRGGRVFVSTRSVEHLRDRRQLREQIQAEVAVSDDLRAFGEEEEAVRPLGATWEGRRPWAANVSAADRA